MKQRSTARALSLLLALLLILAACGESAENTDAPADVGGTDVQTPSAETPVEEETEPDIYVNLPGADYGGADFPLLQYEETSAATSTICVEELNGEAVNDAIYQRTLNVDDRLGINIVFDKTSLAGVTSTMSASIPAGDDYYQAFWQHSTTAVTNFLQKGYVLNLNDISGFDFPLPGGTRTRWTASASTTAPIWRSEISTIISSTSRALSSATNLSS